MAAGPPPWRGRPQPPAYRAVRFGSAVLAASQFAIQIAIAKLAPSALEGSRRLGDWTLANAITGPIFVFFFFKLRVVVTTDTRPNPVCPCSGHRWGGSVKVQDRPVNVNALRDI